MDRSEFEYSGPSVTDEVYSGNPSMFTYPDETPNTYDNWVGPIIGYPDPDVTPTGRDQPPRLWLVRTPVQDDEVFEGELIGPDEVDELDGEVAEVYPLHTSIKLEVLQAEVARTRARYVAMTVRRKEVVFSRRYSKDNQRSARRLYVKARNNAGMEAARLLEPLGLSEEDQRMLKYTAADGEISVLNQEIKQEILDRFDQKRLKAFYEWWARQSNVKWGNLKKAGVLAAVTAVPGAILGPALGVVGGGLIAGGAARVLSRGVIGSYIGRQSQGILDDQGIVERLDRSVDDETYDARRFIGELIHYDVDRDLVTRASEIAVNRAVTRNRGRLAASVALGAAFGSIGAKIGVDFRHNTPLLNPSHAAAFSMRSLGEDVSPKEALDDAL